MRGPEVRGRCLFVTVTNVNFDDDSIKGYIRRALGERDRVAAAAGPVEDNTGAATWKPSGEGDYMERAVKVGIFPPRTRTSAPCAPFCFSG